MIITFCILSLKGWHNSALAFRLDNALGYVANVVSEPYRGGIEKMW